MQRFKKPEMLIFDIFAGMFSVLKGNKRFTKHRKLIGCILDPNGVAEGVLQPILTYAPQIFSEQYYINGDEMVCSTFKKYVNAVVAIGVRKMSRNMGGFEGTSSHEVIPAIYSVPSKCILSREEAVRNDRK